MKCFYLVLILASIISFIFATDVNVYKKDFDETGKAYYYTPNSSFKGQKIAVGEDCTKVEVTVKDANGQTIIPSAAAPLSALQGVYEAQIIRYPGGKCTLPNTQKYNKEVIQSKPEDLVNYYNGKQAPIPKYSFKTENNSESLGIFQNKWILIGVGIAALVAILLIIFLIARSRKNNDEDDKKYTNRDVGMNNNNESKEDLTSKGQTSKGQFGIITFFDNPNKNVNSWDSPLLKSKEPLNTDLLAIPSEPKRVTSITYEEQQNYSKLMKTRESVNQQKTPSVVNIPEEYEKYKSYKIVRKFTPQRNDELVVEIGNEVKLIKSFEDGWTLCYNVETGKEGYIPKNKLAILDNPQKPNIYSETASTNSNYSGNPLLHSESNNSLNGNRVSQGQKSGPDKYYRRPSNESGGYINSNQRNNQRYDM